MLGTKEAEQILARNETANIASPEGQRFLAGRIDTEKEGAIAEVLGKVNSKCHSPNLGSVAMRISILQELVAENLVREDEQ